MPKVFRNDISCGPTAFFDAVIQRLFTTPDASRFHPWHCVDFHTCLRCPFRTTLEKTDPQNPEWCPIRPFTDEDFLHWLEYHSSADYHLDKTRPVNPTRLALAQCYWQIRKAEGSTEKQRAASLAPAAFGTTGFLATLWLAPELIHKLPVSGSVAFLLIILTSAVGSGIAAAIPMVMEEKPTATRREIDRLVSRKSAIPDWL